MALPADGCHFVDRRYIPDPDIGFLFRNMDELTPLWILHILGNGPGHISIGETRGVFPLRYGMLLAVIINRENLVASQWFSYFCEWQIVGN